MSRVAVVGNPRGRRRRAPARRRGRLGAETHELRYVHAEDGEAYRHEFGPGVEVWALEDGRILLEHRDGKPLWAEFDV